MSDLNVQLLWARRRTLGGRRFNSPQPEGAMFGKAWELFKESVTSFINDEALSRGAAIGFYAVTSIGPLLLIIVAIAGLAFGQDAARGAIASQLSGLMGQQSAELLQNVIRSASGKSSGIFASALGFITLLVTASGMFREMQSALSHGPKINRVVPRQ